jgi:VanZ family protein
LPVDNLLSTARRAAYWIPAILVGIVISLFSTHYFNGEQTARFILPILRWIFPHATPRTLRFLHIGIRKLAHILEFGGFSISVFHGIRGPRQGWRWNWAIFTLLIAVAFAALDEWHQFYVPLREARVRDAFIDAYGALVAQTFVWIYSRWQTNRGASKITIPSR